MIVNIVSVISSSVINSAAEINSIWLSASCLIIPEVVKVCADRSYKAWLSGKKALCFSQELLLPCVGVQGFQG
jgi:hypothetical protein